MAFSFELHSTGIELVRNVNLNDVHRFAFLVTCATPTEQSVDCLLITTGVREDLSFPSKPCGVTFELWVFCSSCKKAWVFLWLLDLWGTGFVNICVAFWSYCVVESWEAENQESEFSC